MYHPGIYSAQKELADPDIWNDPEKAQRLGQERSTLSKIVEPIQHLDKSLVDLQKLLSLAIEEGDEDTINELATEINEAKKTVDELEFRPIKSCVTDNVMLI